MGISPSGPLIMLIMAPCGAPHGRLMHFCSLERDFEYYNLFSSNANSSSKAYLLAVGSYAVAVAAFAIMENVIAKRTKKELAVAGGRDSIDAMHNPLTYQI